MAKEKPNRFVGGDEEGEAIARMLGEAQGAEEEEGEEDAEGEVEEEDE